MALQKNIQRYSDPSRAQGGPRRCGVAAGPENLGRNVDSITRAVLQSESQGGAI